MVQQVDEACILLAIDVRQLDVERRIPLQDVRVKEEEAGIILPKHLPLLRLDHGRKLHQVSDEEHLHPTEGERTAAHTTQEQVYEVKRVGTKHTHLVDDQELEGTQ